MRKRFLPFFLAFLILLMAFTGCSTQNEPTADSSGNLDQTSYNGNPSVMDSEKIADSTDSTDSGNDGSESIVDNSAESSGDNSRDNSAESSGDNSTPSGKQTDADPDVPIVYMTTDISPEGQQLP